MGFILYGEKERKYMHDWYVKNKARRNAYFKEWYKQNKEWHLRNVKDKRIEKAYKKWYKETYLEKRLSTENIVKYPKQAQNEATTFEKTGTRPQ